MKAKEWEEIILYRLRQEEELGRATMSRYGVQGSFQKGKPITADYWDKRFETAPDAHIQGIVRELIAAARDSVDTWRPLQSLPDFDLCLGPRGRQCVFDAKVCNQPSFPLDSESKTQSRQLRHMMTRARFGAVCFYLIHFPERTLTRTAEAAQTWAFPIHPEASFWLAFGRGEVKRITKSDCEEYAVPCLWNVLPGGRTKRPDVLSAVYELMGRLPKNDISIPNSTANDSARSASASEEHVRASSPARMEARPGPGRRANNRASAVG